MSISINIVSKFTIVNNFLETKYKKGSIMKVRDDICTLSKFESDVLENPDLQVLEITALTEPGKFKVIMLNDDYTPMDFVVMLLKRYFYKQQDEAIKIMMEIHQCGKGICGIYTKDIAETKIWQVSRHASNEGHPLTCIMEAV
jgi:ATP-dependent Clp protease adaptor protein ClpS